MKERRYPFMRGAIAGLLVVFCIWVAKRVYEKHKYDSLYSFQPGMSVSESQIRAVGEAIGEFTGEYNRRPDRLEMLVASGHIQGDKLFDEQREEIPTIDGQTGQFATNPDVLYFPALKPRDPKGLVMLCTVLLRERDGYYYVVYNDGRYAALSPRELIIALNKTYEYVGGKILQPTTAP